MVWECIKGIRKKYTGWTRNIRKKRKREDVTVRKQNNKYRATIPMGTWGYHQQLPPTPKNRVTSAMAAIPGLSFQGIAFASGSWWSAASTWADALYLDLTLWKNRHLPGLVNIQKAIENGPVEMVDLPIENGGSFHSYVSLQEGMGKRSTFQVSPVWTYKLTSFVWNPSGCSSNFTPFFMAIKWMA